MIRKILMPVRADGKAAELLAHAAVLAHRHKAHVDAVYCRPRPEDLMPYGVPLTDFLRKQIAASAGEVSHVEQEKMRGEFDQWVEAAGLRRADGPNGADASIGWGADEGKQVDIIKTRGRLADIVVVSKPDRSRNLGMNSLRAALFHTGRPVLMCPPSDAPSALGRRIAIAWNGSTEAARAVALTLDLTQTAAEVAILTADREEIHGASAADLGDYLAARGVTAKLERFSSDGSVGRSLLRRSKELRCDMMIMGAYGDSYEKETIFGGNTQVVVDSADSPVVMVH